MALLAAACGSETQTSSEPIWVTSTDDATSDPAGSDNNRPAVETVDKSGNVITYGEPDRTNTEGWSDAVATVDCPDHLPRKLEFICLLVTVPINAADPSGGTTDISVLVWPGTHAADTSNTDDIVLAVLQGGPGSASSDLVEFFPRKRYTQVFIDQRGTGFGSADFDCPEIDEVLLETLGATSDEATKIDLEAVGRCSERLGDHPVLLHTHTTAHATDVIDVMAALGHNRWFVYGVSYGTKIVLTMLQDPPESLVGVVLDGVYPLDLNIQTFVVSSSQRVLSEIDKACAADAGCSSVLPDLSGTVNKLITRLNDEPLIVQLDSEDTSLDQPVEVLIDGDSLAGLLFLFLYSDQLSVLVPLLLSGLEASDDFTAFFVASTAVEYITLLQQTTEEGTYYAAECVDTMPLIADELLDIGLFAAGVLGEGIDAACGLWDMPQSNLASDRDEVKPVNSNLPALLLSGHFDPITPPEFAARVAKNLPNSTQVVLSDGSHGIWVSSDCISQIVDEFLANPNTTPDTSCADESRSLQWLLS